MNTLILCAGNGERFAGGLKQLVRIGDLPLLDRTIAQFLRHSAELKVVTHHAGLCPNPQLLSAPSDRCCTLASLYSCLHWSTADKTAVLLGDVVYSAVAAELICGVIPEKVAFFTDTLDIFAVVFSADAHELVDRQLSYLIGKANDPQHPGLGKMWDWFREFHGMEARCNEEMTHLPALALHHTMIPINDWTQDFDTQEQYKAFARGEAKNAFMTGNDRPFR